ncbi:MAG: glycosyltransferase family 4 protein, partial [Chloroflexi bacterium]|nr:glycosyltransferase family 4 protein [Chloroflexota bacterium]
YLSFIQAPESAAPSLRRFLNNVVPRSIARAHHVLADSEATRQDVIAEYGTAPTKISVLYSGVDPRFSPITDPDHLSALRQRYQIGEARFVLAVGTVQPRKNYARLAEAVAAQADPDVKLVIAGGKGWLEDDLYRRIDALKLGQRVQFLGFVPDEDLPSLYSAAEILAFPSLYEGFGLPILEAMACGTPVLTANVSSMPEVAGDAALLVDPTSVDALADALTQLLDRETLRTTLIERGFAQAKRFTWAKAARQLRQTYATLLDEAP